MKQCKCEQPTWEVQDNLMLQCKSCMEYYYIEHLITDHQYIKDTQPKKFSDDGIRDYQVLRKASSNLLEVFRDIVPQYDYAIAEEEVYNILTDNKYKDVHILVKYMYQTILKLQAQELMLKHRLHRRESTKYIAEREFPKILATIQSMAYNMGKSKGFWEEQLTSTLDDNLNSMLDIVVAANQIEAARKGISVEDISIFDIDIIQGVWDDKQKTISQKLALIVTEIVEAFDTLEDIDKLSNKLPDYTELSLELADVLIRLLDLSGWLKIDLGEGVLAKMKYNETRGHKHGNKF